MYDRLGTFNNSWVAKNNYIIEQFFMYININII